MIDCAPLNFYFLSSLNYCFNVITQLKVISNDPSKKNRSKKVKYGALLCFLGSQWHFTCLPPPHEPPLGLVSFSCGVLRIAIGTLIVAQHK